MTESSGELNICAKCIGNKAFAKWIRKNGKPGKCDFDPSHGRRGKAVSIEQFAQQADAYFRSNFQRGREQPYYSDDSDKVGYEQAGDTYENILADELGCDENVVHTISQNLPDVSDREIQKGADPFYEDYANYESIKKVEVEERAEQEEFWYENRFTYQWQEFCEIVQYQRRFFKIKELLDDLFGDPKEFETGTIKPVYALEAGGKIFRARLIDDGFSREKLQKNPAGELGAPPQNRARAGRMNVEYIPAFYGAFSDETAVAEIRPGIGEEIAIGEFELRQPLKVFDFTVFTRSSHEQRKDSFEHTRYDFVDQLESEISKPILPFEKQREYIPTQIVAEYLKTHFGCEAVIYRSSMIKDRAAESRNIVILNRGPNGSFEGSANSPLAFGNYKVKEVIDVKYELVKWHI